MFTIIFCNTLPPNSTEFFLNKAYMTCIDFDMLNQLKNLETIRVFTCNMSYFPDKDCNNSIQDEATRPLELPNLKTLLLRNVRLLKAPDVSLMPKLEMFNLPENGVKEISGTPFINNHHLKIFGFFDNDLTV